MEGKRREAVEGGRKRKRRGEIISYNVLCKFRSPRDKGEWVGGILHGTQGGKFLSGKPFSSGRRGDAQSPARGGKVHGFPLATCCSSRHGLRRQRNLWDCGSGEAFSFLVLAQARISHTAADRVCISSERRSCSWVGDRAVVWEVGAVGKACFALLGIV